MKTVLVLLLWIFILGCKKESTPSVPLSQKIDTTKSKPASTSGIFSNGPYGIVMGTARVYLLNGKYQLALENYKWLW